jgi:3-dehydroquinate dehydratase / shikimate dehydrogenase
MSVKICETVMAKTMKELRAARDASAADIVELRLDGVADLDVAGALADRRRPVIVTCRSAAEGGRFEGAEETRLGVLAQAIRLNAEYIDVEWRADRASLPWGKVTQIVLSHHVFDGVPADLRDRVRAMRGEIVDVVKVAVTATSLRDCVSLRDAIAGHGRHVAIAMGEPGWITRTHPALFGSQWSYAGTAAPGQLSPTALRECYRIAKTTAATALYAIAGAPLAHSASPAMHNAAFRHLKIDAVFVPLESPDAADFNDIATAFGVQGASVTAPLKQAMLQFVGLQDREAEDIGTINTLRRGALGWEARNFDADGFLAPIEARGWELWGKRAVVLGAGGAARTAAWVLSRQGAEVAIAGRDRGRTAALAEAVGVLATAWPPEGEWDLLVNATPVGTWPDHEHAPISLAAVKAERVYDLVYNPEDTRLLREARAAGADTLGGLDMLLAQAARQFEWWTGQPAPVEVMRSAALAFLAERISDHDEDEKEESDWDWANEADNL